MNSIISINKIHLLQKELNPFLIKFVFSENRAEIELGNSIYWTDFEFRIQNTDYFLDCKKNQNSGNQPDESKPVIGENRKRLGF